MNNQIKLERKNLCRLYFLFSWFVIIRSLSWLFLPKLSVSNGYPNTVFCLSLLISVSYLYFANKVRMGEYIYVKRLLIVSLIELLLFYFIGIRYIEGQNLNYLQDIVSLSFADLKQSINLFALLGDLLYFFVLLINSIYGLLFTVFTAILLFRYPIDSEVEPLVSIKREYFESIMIAVLLAVAIRTYGIQAFKIPSGSMEDTLLIGDHLLVNKFLYGQKFPIIEGRHLIVRDPKRGDVIVFEYPEDPSKDFIKRVIGTPGDVIEEKDKQVYVNGQPYVNPHEVHKENDLFPREQNPRDNFGPVKVPEGSYFMMGDNRDRSYDSRFWGFVKNSKIKGLAFIKYWSWDSTKFRVRWGNIGRLID